MGWSIGYDSNWNRDIGYGVPAICDHPGCSEEIDRGLGCVCGGDPYGGEEGCGLFFCGKHLLPILCERCSDSKEPFEPKPDILEWIHHKLIDPSWQSWRDENPDKIIKLKEVIYMEMENEKIARVAHEVNKAYCEALGDMSQPVWEEAPEWQRASATSG